MVERKPGLCSPIGLASMTIAPVSERKSTVDRNLMKPVNAFEKSMEASTKVRMDAWHAAQSVRNAKKEGLMRAISRLTSHGEDASTFVQQLEGLAATSDDKPVPIRRVLQRGSKDSILLFLKKYGNSCGVMVDEGDVFLSSSASKHAGLLAQLWSGDDIHIEEEHGEGFTVRSPRFTMAIMVQPEVLKSFLMGRGKHWRNTGLLSRFLVNFPMSTQGTRFEDVDFPQTVDLPAYDARIQEILSSPHCLGECESITLKFEESARRALAEYANHLEWHIRPFNYFADVADAASKIAENTARMAANFHIFEGHEGLISEETLRRAQMICDWHLNEFKRIFGLYPQVPLIEQDAQDVERCVNEYQRQQGWAAPFPKARLARFAHGAIRKDPRRREDAINYLIQCNRLTWFRDNKTLFLNFVPQVVNNNLIQAPSW